MALARDSGRPIGSTGFGALGGDEVPGVEWRRQEQKEWCWAACMDMVLRAGGTERDQCALANEAFGLNGCCASGESSLCDRPLSVLAISGEWERNSHRATFVNDKLEFPDVQREVGARNAIELGLRWSRGKGHAVLIVGWSRDDEDEVDNVVVLDPQRERLVVPYDEILQAYGLGTWRWSWTGIRKNAEV